MRRFAWPVAALAGLAFVAAAYWPKEPTDESAWDYADSTFSPGPRGTKGFYRLLEDLGMPVQRMRRASFWQLPPGTALWDLSPLPLGAIERRFLLEFVRRGGTFVGGRGPLAKLLGEAGLGEPDFDRGEGEVASLLPDLALKVERYATIDEAAAPDRLYLVSPTGAPVVASWKVGRGRLVFLGVPDAVRNDQIGNGDDGPFFVRLAFDLGARQAFDEFDTGFGDQGLASLFVHAPYRWGLLQLALALLALLWATGARRWPAEAEVTLRRRETLDHVAAVARLWERGGDLGLPLEALLGAFEGRARVRLGEGGENAFRRWIGSVRPELGERATRAWLRAEELSRRRQPPFAAVRQAVEDLFALEKEALAW